MMNFGYHAVYEKDYQSAITAAARGGFQYVQFDLDVPEFFLETLSKRQISDIKSTCVETGVELSFHAPSDSIGLFTAAPLIRKGMHDHIKRILQILNDLDAHHLTVHPLNPPSFRRADTLEDSFQQEHEKYYVDLFKSNLDQFTNTAGRVLIAVENLWLGPIANAALTEMFQVGTDIFLSLDWAKMHKAGPTPDETQNAFFLKHRQRIRELHLHDFDEKGRSHLSPGQGKLNFVSLFKDFYDESQWLTIEVRPFDEALKAKAIFKDMIEQMEGT
jgi:sugar phosphate isomerase/epimerase